MAQVFIKGINMKTISYSKLAIFMTALAIISGCESTSNTTEAGDLSASNQALNNLVSDNACTASFQCKVLAVGQRACGGASRYVIYSTLNTEQAQAELLAQQVTEQEILANKSNGASDCLPVLPVQALCIDQQCQPFEIK